MALCYLELGMSLCPFLSSAYDDQTPPSLANLLSHFMVGFRMVCWGAHGRKTLRVCHNVTTFQRLSEALIRDVAAMSFQKAKHC